MYKTLFSKLSTLGCIVGLTLSGCGGASQTVPFPTVTYAYVMSQLVTVPGVPPPTGSWSDGYGYADPVDGVYLLADRTTAGLDVVQMSTLAFLRVAGQGSFVGDRTTPKHAAGPNSVVSIGNGVAVGTDGNSDVVFVNVNTGATLGTVTFPNTGSTPNRADLIGYDSKDNVVLVGSDASSPSPVLTFVSTIAPYAMLGQIFLTTSTGGVEQPTYDPAQGVFLVSVPSTTANPSGEIDVVSPTSMAITKVYPVGGNCGPTGSALGPNEELGVSCSNVPAGSQILDATTGASLATIPAANGCDEAWYNTGDNRFFFACSHDATGSAKTPLVGVVDAGTKKLITTIPTQSSSNAVSVDPATNRVFIPERKGNIGIVVYSYE